MPVKAENMLYKPAAKSSPVEEQKANNASIVGVVTNGLPTNIIGMDANGDIGHFGRALAFNHGIAFCAKNAFETKYPCELHLPYQNAS